MPKRGENITKRKDGRWEGRIYGGFKENGRRKYQSIYGKSYLEVKNKMLTVERGTLFCNELKRGINKKLFGEIAEEWLKRKHLEVKITTFSTYQRILNSQIIPDLGFMQMGKITSDFLREFLLNKLSNGKLDGSGGISVKTAKDIQILLNNIFKFAEKEYGIKNPCINIKMLKTDKKEIIVLNEEERKKFTIYLLEHLNENTIGILISMYMGLRIGEVCALRWKDIDIDHKILKVCATSSRIINPNKNEIQKTKVVIHTPKSSASIREIPIPDFLMQYFTKAACFAEESAYVLTGTLEKSADTSTYRKFFKRCLKKNGIREVPYHSLRHGFATLCIEIGFDPKTVSELLGHSGVGITLNRYVHSSFVLKKEQMNKLSKIAIA